MNIQGGYWLNHWSRLLQVCSKMILAKVIRPIGFQASMRAAFLFQPMLGIVITKLLLVFPQNRLVDVLHSLVGVIYVLGPLITICRCHCLEETDFVLRSVKIICTLFVWWLWMAFLLAIFLPMSM